MASYNGARYIGTQIDSILCQLGPEDELIVSDDGSTDDTWNIVEAFRDPRIVLVKNHQFAQPKIAGPYLGPRRAAKNFENALSLVRGKFIFFSDQDDFWKPDRVKFMLEKLTDCDLVITNMDIVDENGTVIQEHFHRTNPIKATLFKNLLASSTQGCCMAFRREVLEYALPFPKRVISHDLWIANLVFLKGSAQYFDVPYLDYRRHGSNASSTSSVSTTSPLAKLSWRLELLFQLLHRARRLVPKRTNAQKTPA